MAAFNAGSLHKFLTKFLRDGQVAFGPGDERKFIRALLALDDPVDVLYKLTNPQEHGLKRLKAALALSDNSEFIISCVSPFLAVLGSDALARGTCRQPLADLLNAMYCIPGFTTSLKTSLTYLPDPGPVAWFFLNVARTVDSARTDPVVTAVAEQLRGQGGAAGQVGRELQNLIAPDSNSTSAAPASSNTMCALEDLRAQAGGRHDNDHTDFRSIQIMPTSEEVLCPKLPFLPLSSETTYLGLTPEASTLDRHFRLLREDMVGPLRKELAALGVASPADAASGSSQAKRPAQVQASRNVYVNPLVLGVCLHPRPCVIVSVSLPGSHKAAQMRTIKEREEFWKEFGRGTLPMDGLVCLVSPGRPIMFGTVVRREPREMAEPRPIVGLSFESVEDVAWLMQYVGKTTWHGLPAGSVLVQINSNLFSIKPTLLALQDMASVPLAEELVHLQHPKPLSYMAASRVEQVLQSYPGSLDPSQQSAWRMALSQRVSLIQGPPGTGKTFMGVLLCDTIVKHTTETILCVCYTNHALDQFLEALLDKGITSIVRIGSRGKSERLEPYNMRNLAKQGPFAASLPERRRAYELNVTMELATREATALEKALLADQGPADQQQRAHNPWLPHQQRLQEAEQLRRLEREQRGKSYDLDLFEDPGPRRIDWWSLISSWLQEEHPEYWEQLRMPADLVETGARIYSDHLWRLWLQGKPRDYRVQPARLHAGVKDLWALRHWERKQLAAPWFDAARYEVGFSMAEQLHRVERAKRELTSLHDSSWEAVLRGARVIGCTTTGAAMFKHLLGSLKPGVVMVEEAGELLEAHVLTSVGPGTKHLIMIGDHKQLRPKVESYELTKESGKGYNLNVSMFERLVLGGLPFSTLAVQHRMHPDISRLVRPTYPKLEDHPSVQHRAPVLGLGSQRVVFIDHNQPELQEKDGRSWGGNSAHQSKVNPHEVDMSVAIVRYLLQQGYDPQQLVVLTPYLGQLLEIQQALSKVVAVTLDDLDMADLRKAGQVQVAVGGGGNEAKKKGVRVATIDNYQGEEADVVVASLVRCNKDGKVGFLREPERINVLLSRARCGLIMLGSAHTLLHASSPAARQHWGKVLGLLQERGSIFSGLPAVCQTHQCAANPLLSTPDSFKERCPDGGCWEACGAELPCGHRCPRRCHPTDRDHRGVRCVELVYSTCSAGHMTTKTCSAEAVACETCQEIRRIEKRARDELVKLEGVAARARSKTDVEAAELRAQMDQMQQLLSAMEDETRRKQQAVLQEIEAAKLKKTLALQQAKVAGEQAVWEEEQRRAAQEALDALDRQAAELEEQQARELEVAKQARLQAEQYLAERRAALSKVDKDTQRELQRVENNKQRLETEAQDQTRAIGMSGRRQAVLLSSASTSQPKHWVSDLAVVGLPGVDTFRQKLLSAYQQEQDGFQDTLDVVFGQGMAGNLLQYAQGQGGGSQPGDVKPLQRGLALVAEGKWLDAMDFFQAQLPKGADGKPTSTGSPLVSALTQVCSVKLGMSDKTQAWKLPATSPCAQHPLQHLANAFTAATATAPRTTDLLSLQRARGAAASAVGEALAVLLHPGCGQLPEGLLKHAMQLVTDHSKSLTSPAAALAAATSGGASGSSSSSSVRNAWKDRAKKSQALTKLLDLIGMAPVKENMFSLADQVELDKERGRSLTSRQYHIRFYGNPGTGKTTVARIYAELLKELKVLPEAEVVETSGAAMANGGVTELKKQLEKLAKGGVLFVDEAYQLNPKMNPAGAQVLDFLLPEMENKRDKLVVVFAGYAKQMDELMSFNEGLPSRFPTVFTFPDYNADELYDIFMGILKAGKPQPFKLEDDRWARILAKRLSRQAGSVGFGNARAVRNAYEQCIQRQSARVLEERKQGLNPDTWLLVRDDMLGPKTIDESRSAALCQLRSMHGLRQVKESVDTLLQVLRTNAELEEMQRPTKDICLNRVFLGNPGTGKTTVAGIYGQILKDLGLLSKGEVVVRNPSDFIGSVLGESEKKTVALLEATVGCVLVIDEAYGLHSPKGSDVYKTAVVDTIVAKVQGLPGDDRCVLMLGYQEQMDDMMRNTNPGLARRFQYPDGAWHFEDYNNEDLFHITKEAAKRKGWSLGYEELRACVAVLDKQRRKPNFGNAGAVNNLLASVAQRMETRLKGLPAAERATAQPTVADILPPEDLNPSDPREIFSDLIGCQQVLSKLQEWQSTIKASQRLGKDPLASFEMNFLFVGSPGTGKTTVARRVGMLFKSLGLLASSDVVGCSASDFVTGYAGQASGQTRQMFDKALGQVLFIDEAYRLNPKSGGPYMSEVLDEIVQILTEPKYMKKMVVILAGYEHEVEELMTINPGLKSRFSERLHFPDFTVDDSCQLYNKQLQSQYAFTLSPEAQEALPGLMQQLMAAPAWSNGRDVGTLTARTFRCFSQRTADTEGPVEDVVTLGDVTAALAMCLETKRVPDKPRGTTRPTLDWGSVQQESATATAPPAPELKTATDTATTTVTAVAASDPPCECKHEVEEQQLQTAGPGSFGGLDSSAILKMQAALERLGYDTSSLDVMFQLAQDPNMASVLAAALPDMAAGLLKDWVTKWQQAMREQMEKAMEAKKKGLVPRWRCAACGRTWCKFAPYIEGYDEIELP